MKEGIRPLFGSFADPIKKAMSELGVSKDANPEAYRELAQKCGARLRQENDDWFVIQMDKHVERVKNVHAPDVLIIDDCRYDNEMSWVKKHAGLVIWVDSGDRLDTTLPVYGHESERLAVDYSNGERIGSEETDFTVLSTGSMDEYEEELQGLSERLIRYLRTK